MATAHELLCQGKHQELWQMCCGFLSLSIEEFMGIQERLLMKQLELLGASSLGGKLLHRSRPATVEEFRRLVPLTTYMDYCPELLEKREETLPASPLLWAHSSGRSDDYPYKWVPIASDYACELSKVLFAVGILSCAEDWGDTSRIPINKKVLFSVAPRPYISGTFADLLRMQTPMHYLPPLEEAEGLTFEERLKLGFQQAVGQGLDYFFGLSLVLVTIGERFSQSSQKVDLRPYLKQPRALIRLARGKLKSRLAGRNLLPKDLWSLKGIIGSGVDSWVYKDKIKEFWGRCPLDLYSCTEGGVIATQTWDYEGMTFVPNLNFLEFIPEDEQFKNQLDRSYQPKTLLLNEVKAGEEYEIVITNFYGGAMTRYRIGDVVKITSLKNDRLGINLPQMAFERRTDDLLNFTVIKLNEKQIWQSLEKTGFAYEDWVAFKIPGEPMLHVLIEPKGGVASGEDLAQAIQHNIVASSQGNNTPSGVREDWRDSLDFNVEVTYLSRGTFSKYTAQKRAEGADLAHLKPVHINPSRQVLSLLLAETQETIIVTKAGSRKKETSGPEKIKIS
jgi:hypothetical protein